MRAMAAIIASAAVAASAAAVASAVSSASSDATPLWPAVIGFVGVLIGLGVNTGKEVVFARSKRKADEVYLSIMVGAYLSQYILKCFAIANDDGRSNDPWHDDSDDERSAQVKEPEFKPLEMQVEWKVLSAQLLFDIMDIPHEQKRIEGSIYGEFVMNDDRPHHTDAFWKRREMWAYHGLRVSEIADRLRKLTGLNPSGSVEGDWTVDDGLREAIEKVKEERRLRDERVAAYKAAQAARGETPLV